MKLTTWELQGGLKFALETPTTVEEYNGLAGTRPADENSTGIPVLDDAINNTMYRGPFADVRFALAKALEVEYTDPPRGRKDHPQGKKDENGAVIQVFDESEGKYIARVAATKGVAITSFQNLLDKIMADNAALPTDSKDKIKLDPSQRERRGPSSTEPGKLDTETATALIAQGNKKLRISLSKIVEKVPTVDVTLVGSDDPDAAAKNLRTVALAVKAYGVWLKSTTASALAA